MKRFPRSQKFLAVAGGLRTEEVISLPLPLLVEETGGGQGLLLRGPRGHLSCLGGRPGSVTPR